MTHQFYFWAYTQKNWKKELNRYLHIQVHKSILNNSQEVEAAQVPSMNEWETQCDDHIWWNIIQPWKGTQDRDTYSTDQSWTDYTKRNKPVKKKITMRWYHLYEVPGIVRFKGTEGRLVVTRDCGGEELHNGWEFPFGMFWRRMRVMPAQEWMHLAPLNCILHHGENANIYGMYMSYNKKKTSKKNKSWMT